MSRTKDPAELEKGLKMAEALARTYGSRLPLAQWDTHREDLLGTARLMCLRAWQSYDPDLGFRFSTYCYRPLLGAMGAYLKGEHVPVETVPLDALVPGTEDVTFADLVPDERVDVEAEAIAAAGGELAPYVARLKKRQRLVIERQLRGQPLAEIARELRVTRQAVDYLNQRALRNLRAQITMARRTEGCW